MSTDIILKIFLALLIGAVIGLERQIGDDPNRAGFGGGVRTFALVGLLGAIGGLFYVSGFPLVFVLIAACFFALVVSFYILGSKITSELGLTTEIALLLTFVFGVLLTTQIVATQLVLAMAVVLAFILALRTHAKWFGSNISRTEVESFIGYAIIALVILPFLPSQSFTVSDIPLISQLFGSIPPSIADIELLNPRKVWYVVALVTGIDVLGYVLSRFVGKKSGFTVSSFIAGFVSSTSTTISLAIKSRNSSSVYYLAGAAILANAASFIQIFLLIGPLNPSWLISLVPVLLIMIIVACFIAYYLLTRKESHVVKANGEDEDRKIFSLVPALKFACVLVVVKIVTGFALALFGQSGFLVSSVLASFVGIDAILVNLADLAGESVTFTFAMFAFILVNATNLLSKTFYAYMQGSRKFANTFAVSAVVIVAASFIGFIF